MEAITGFLMSRQWRETPQGFLLKYWLHTINGPTLIEQTHQEGVFFVEKCHLDDALRLCHSFIARTRALPLKSFNQTTVIAFYFSSQKDLRQAASTLKKHQIEPLEADVRTVDRYLMERFITGAMVVHTENIDTLPQHQVVRNGQIKPVEFTPSFRVISFDIETDYRSSELLSIAVYSEQEQLIMMVSNDDTITINQCQLFPDERSLLIAFISWFQQHDPDIIIGWNCINFDLRVLEKASQRLGVSFAIGRNNETLEWRNSPNNEGHYFVLVPGRAVLDGIDTLKSATYSFESFSLEAVSRQLLGKGKLIHDPDDRGEEILRLFDHDKPALAKYNLEDCKLVWDIFQKADLIQFATERARLTGLPIDKIGGSVAAFENQYLPRLHRQGYVAPNLPVDPQGVGSPGGYVMSSRPGLYDNVLVLDFKSLYPSIIRSFLIDPYGLTEGDRLMTSNEFKALDQSQFDARMYDKSEFSKGFRGAFFKKQDTILPGLIEHLWQARDKAKQANSPALSQAIKIIMNSFYGVMGTPGCRFFDARLPSSITLRGHEIMTRTQSLIEAQGYDVIYGDTDSIFVWLNQNASYHEANNIGAHLAKYITQWWKTHLEQEFQLDSALELEYESYYTRFLMPTIRGSEKGSKKRYAGLVGDANFSLQSPVTNSYQLVFKGLETVRTDWTHLAREFQKELYERIFLNREFKTYIRQITQDLKAGKFNDKLIYRKRLRRKLNEYQRNVPPHAQAAKKADEWLVQQGKKTRYQQGGWVSYYYTTNGPEPIECINSPLDYELYLERQIAPIVDGIVGFLGTSFDEITSGQMTLL
jgi:DNA polymerase-2